MPQLVHATPSPLLDDTAATDSRAILLVLRRGVSTRTEVSTRVDALPLLFELGSLATAIATAALPSRLYVNEQSGRLHANNSCGDVSEDSAGMTTSDALRSRNATVSGGHIVTGSSDRTAHMTCIDGPTLPAASTAHIVTTGVAPSGDVMLAVPAMLLPLIATNAFVVTVGSAVSESLLLLSR
jgi:hypothetical protein